MMDLRRGGFRLQRRMRCLLKRFCELRIRDRRKSLFDGVGAGRPVKDTPLACYSLAAFLIFRAVVQDYQEMAGLQMAAPHLLRRRSPRPPMARRPRGTDPVRALGPDNLPAQLSTAAVAPRRARSHSTR